MSEKLATWAVAITALACVGGARAHHSVSMFELSTPIWVKGTVVRYTPVNPHALFALEVRGDDGQFQQWTVEGPSLKGLTRSGVPADLLKVGDVIEVCGFPYKEDVLARISATRRVSQPFVHGHVLVMPDGEMRNWGGYGRLDNCVRPGDETQVWLKFLNNDTVARERWCGSRHTPVGSRYFPVAPIAPPALVDEISRLMAYPCD
ncbi:MAG TPA: DUF6152 family protein [Gammaproteobacteria bacterium]|nr:DUF6152 family protein [Gammaproteobacteria bacterium]